MQYRPYGKQGYDVSLLGMGCMRLPRITSDEGSVSVDREKSFEMIRYAADNGINYFDTAFVYHSGESEEILGEALEGRRSRVKIATKQLFPTMQNSKEIMRRNLEVALKKLRTDHIDIYLIHSIGEGTWQGIKELGVIEEYEKFMSEGMIKAIGFSYHGDFPLFREVLGYYDWAMCQVQQNLLDSDDEVTEEGIREAGKKGCALVIMEPLRGGGLSKASKPVFDIYDRYSEKRTPAEWAFRFMIDKPEVSTILSGMSTIEQIKDNIRIFSAPDVLPNCLNETEHQLLAEAKAAYLSRTAIPCTGCEYCLPCPQGVDIPGIFAGYNEGFMFDSFENPMRSYMFIKTHGEGAERCVECGACLTKCPQHIGIIEQLKLAGAKLDGWRE